MLRIAETFDSTEVRFLLLLTPYDIFPFRIKEAFENMELLTRHAISLRVLCCGHLSRECWGPKYKGTRINIQMPTYFQTQRQGVL